MPADLLPVARMKEAREVAGWSQADLGNLLTTITGEVVPRETVAGWERRGGPVPKARAAAVRQALELPLKYLSEGVTWPYADWVSDLRQRRTYDAEVGGASPARIAADAFTSSEQYRISKAVTGVQVADAIAQSSTGELLEELGRRHAVTASALGGSRETDPNIDRAQRILAATGAVWAPDEMGAGLPPVPAAVPSGRRLGDAHRAIALMRAPVDLIAAEASRQIGAMESVLVALGGPLDPAVEYRAGEILRAALDPEPHPDGDEELRLLTRRALRRGAQGQENDK